MLLARPYHCYQQHRVAPHMLAKGPATARVVQHNVLVGRPVYINLVGKLHYLPSEGDF